MQGRDAMVLTYGATKSGKTYTLEVSSMTCSVRWHACGINWCVLILIWLWKHGQEVKLEAFGMCNFVGQSLVLPYLILAQCPLLRRSKLHDLCRVRVD